MRSLLWFVVLAGGCSKTDPLYCTPEHHLNDDPATCGAAGVDAPHAVDAAPTVDAARQLCLGSGKWAVCAPMPTQPADLPGTLDTGSNPKCQTNLWTASGQQPDACFIVGTKITTLSGDVQVTGTRPLVLIAATTIEISVKLDVASHIGGKTGPGGRNGSGCTGGAAGNPAATNYGGGGGGSFQTAGGGGGGGNGVSASAGLATNLVTPTQLMNGCAGTQGGGLTGQGIPGAGGGAVYLLAGDSITIDGEIDASGAGGGANTDPTAPHFNGGSGGGSGGMIALVAPMVTGSGSLYANGGGGGGGADGANMIGGAGMDPAVATTAAPGGGGTKGGVGSVGTTAGVAGATGGAGKSGGGGGGGGGYVAYDQAFMGSLTVSPTRTNLP